MEGGGRGGTQAGLNDRALFGAVALVRIGSSPDNSRGHRSSETRGERANESVLSSGERASVVCSHGLRWF